MLNSDTWGDILIDGTKYVMWAVLLLLLAVIGTITWFVRWPFVLLGWVK